jgi:hypothetical protein
LDSLAVGWSLTAVIKEALKKAVKKGATKPILTLARVSMQVKKASAAAPATPE